MSSGLTAPDLTETGPAGQLPQPHEEVDSRRPDVVEWVKSQAERATLFSQAVTQVRESVPGVEWTHHHGRNLPVHAEHRAIPRGSHLVDFEPIETDPFSKN